MQDCVEIAKAMRSSDRREVMASHGLRPFEAVYVSFVMSVVCWTADVDGRPVAMFGCCPGQGYGLPWMLATEDADRYPVHVYRRGVLYIAKMLDHFPVLINWVHAQNAPSIDWLRYCGAIIEEANPYGVSGEPFHKFYFVR